MAIEARAGAMPLWMIIDLAGKLAGGAKMYTKRSLNKTENKPVYYDASRTIAYINPILFGLNGTSPTQFFFEYDTDHPEDTYYIEVYDADDNLLWTLDNYTPGEGGGGSGSTYLPFRNLITNNIFLYHTHDRDNPLTEKDIFIAPSNHVGFTPNQLNPVITNNGIIGPDIWFTKNNLNALDDIKFGIFNAGDDPLTGDVTPLEYIRYQCGNNPLGEEYKHFQFPINAKVNSLDNQKLTMTVYARSQGGDPNLRFYLRQYFGSGVGGDTEVFVLVGNKVLTGVWTKYIIDITVPNTAGKGIGSCNDDALYLCIGMPLGAFCDISFTKPSAYLGQIPPALEFETDDQITATLESPRTGQVKYLMANYTPSGWLPMDGRSIGIANKENTFFLYKTLYDSISDLYAPVSGGRTGNAINDYAAGKTLKLIPGLGRMLMGMAPLDQTVAFTATAANGQLAVSDATIFSQAQPIYVNGSAIGLTDRIFYVIPVDGTHIKLADTVEAAIAGTALTVTNGTGNITSPLGAQGGESKHQLTIAEMPSHNHPGSFAVSSRNDSGGGVFEESGGPENNLTVNVAAQGGNQPHNNIPPYLGANIFIKL